MTYVLSGYRPWMAAAILSSTVVLSACGGASGANSALAEKHPSTPGEQTAESAPNTGTQPPSQGSYQPGSEQVGNNSGLDSSPGPSVPTDPVPNNPPIVSGEDVQPGSPPTAGEPIEADGAVVLMWTPPTERENGEPLYDTELGGYEIRYRQPDQEAYETITIENRLAEFYEFHDLVGTYYFQIAAYDTDGLYSEFVNIRPID